MLRNSLTLVIFSLISFPILAQPPNYSLCSHEHIVCSYPFYLMGDTSAAYGANGSFAFRNVDWGIGCDATSLEWDPAPGIAKACYVPTDPAGFVNCAAESASCRGRLEVCR
jgi:hypothetical protein